MFQALTGEERPRTDQAEIASLLAQMREAQEPLRAAAHAAGVLADALMIPEEQGRANHYPVVLFNVHIRVIELLPSMLQISL